MRQFNNVRLPDILELNYGLPHLKEEQFELDAAYACFWDEPINGVCMVVVPAGYVTDLSSIPRWARSLIPVVGRQNGPSVIHDYLYEPMDNDRPEGQHQKPGWTKAEVDKLFLDAMKAVGVNYVRRNLMYAAVKYGGGSAWRTKDK